jgi:hypothetical protein
VEGLESISSNCPVKEGTCNTPWLLQGMMIPAKNTHTILQLL